MISAVIIAAAARRAWPGALAVACLTGAYLISVLSGLPGPPVAGQASVTAAWTNATSYPAFYALAAMGLRLLRSTTGQAETLRQMAARLSAERSRVTAAGRAYQVGHDIPKALLREVRRGTLPPERLRAWAPQFRADLLRELAADPRAPVVLREELGRVAATYAAGMQLKVNLAAMATQPPGVPALLMAEAVRELLNNASYHRYGYPARLTGSASAERVEVSVYNDGPGVEPRRWPAPGRSSRTPFTSSRPPAAATRSIPRRHPPSAPPWCSGTRVIAIGAELPPSGRPGSLHAGTDKQASRGGQPDTQRSAASATAGPGTPTRRTPTPPPAMALPGPHRARPASPACGRYRRVRLVPTSRLIAVAHVHDSYPLRVLAVGSRGTTVMLSNGPDAAEPGTFRLAWPGGQARAGPVTASGPGFVTRQLSHVSGRLVSGERAGIEPGLYTGDPLTALGIPFTAVGVPTPLGGMPAWRISGRRSTWVILIHGLGGSRADTLPVMPGLHALGFPMLAITYRNDVGAPASPDRQSHLGATEWHDVEAAVRFATSQGASSVVLFGYSLGGAMAAVTTEDSSLRGQIRGLVLDSPILDWRATLDYQGRRHGLPQPLTSLTETLLSWRTGISYAQFDQLQHEASLRVPVLLIQGSADTIVPPRRGRRLRPRLPRLGDLFASRRSQPCRRDRYRPQRLPRCPRTLPRPIPLGTYSAPLRSGSHSACRP